jgi:hypothetical protein
VRGGAQAGAGDLPEAQRELHAPDRHYRDVVIAPSIVAVGVRVSRPPEARIRNGATWPQFT